MFEQEGLRWRRLIEDGAGLVALEDDYPDLFRLFGQADAVHWDWLLIVKPRGDAFRS